MIHVACASAALPALLTAMFEHELCGACEKQPQHSEVQGTSTFLLNIIVSRPLESQVVIAT